MATAQAEGVNVPRASDVRALPGRGMAAEVDGRRLRLGSSRLMEELGVDRSALRSQADRLAAEGRTVSWLADVTDQPQLLCLLAFGDTVKASAVAAIARLRSIDVQSVLVTHSGRSDGAKQR